MIFMKFIDISVMKWLNIQPVFLHSILTPELFIACCKKSIKLLLNPPPIHVKGLLQVKLN